MEVAVPMPPIVPCPSPLRDGSYKDAPPPSRRSSSSPTVKTIAPEVPVAPSLLPPSSRTTTLKEKKKQHGRRVTIELSRNETIVLDENLCSCANDIWYEPDHFVTMKAIGKCDAREGRRLGLGALLQDTFAVPASDAQDRIAAFCRLDGSSSTGTEDTTGIAEESLVYEYLYSTSRRGLERSLSKKHGDERSEHKDRARRAVLIHQASLNRRGVKADEIAQKIAAVYTKHCRSAKVFARRFGIGDELAAAADAEDVTGSPSAVLRMADAHEVLYAALGGGDVDGGERSTGACKSGLCLLEDNAVDNNKVSGRLVQATAPSSRRYSNASSMASSIRSVNSYDSNRRFCGGGDRSRNPPRRTSSRTCPGSPPNRSQSSNASNASSSQSSPTDELYAAAIA